MTSSTTEHPAVTRFREYLRIKTMQPNPDYEGSNAFLINQANEIGMPYKIVEVSLVHVVHPLGTSLCISLHNQHSLLILHYCLPFFPSSLNQKNKKNSASRASPP